MTNTSHSYSVKTLST